ncbi:MAG TPA: hypothetical protein VK668_11285 [Mucilaginibacter sp.]|nr:hypothetical protein [Mucilaginibacter sp.]
MPYRSKILSVACKAICIACFLLLACHSISLAQSSSLKNDLIKLQASADSSIKKSPAEKIYIQFDKPYYATGDTAWFKIYLFNAPSHLLSAKSGLLYVDMMDDSDRLIKQYLLPVKNGVSWGNITLDNKVFKTGSYTLRAYTNWMRNFTPDGFYYKQLYISGTDENSWLINSEIKTSRSINDKTPVNAQLQFTGLDKVPDTGKFMQLKVLSGTKTPYKQKVKTDQNGLLNLNFQLPEKSSKPAIIVESEQKDQKAVIPLNLNRAEKIDLQFLPEGGSLVADLPANVGFKAIGENGKGAHVSGFILDHNHQQVAVFQSTHNGMGKFNLMVRDGEVYTAQISLPGGEFENCPLPQVKSSGTTLQIKNVMASDSIEVSVAATDDIARSGNSYFLIGKSRGIICYAAILNFHEGNYIRRKIARSLFPSGIAHFILATPSGQPLNERPTFIDHQDNLRIQIISNQPEYALRDSISLQLKVMDETGNPVAGNFSMAVTDAAMVKTDTLNDENIITNLLLTSDLKGYVEEPGYYLQPNAIAWQALDNLLLTQGWVSYEPILPQLPFEAEKEFAVKGRVVNVFGKPVKGSKLLLFSKSPPLLMDTVANNEGKFVFNHFPVVDTPVFIIKAVNRRGKSFNVGINIDEIKPPPFGVSGFPKMMPWYVNSDTTFINYIKDNITINKQQEYMPDGKRKLKEVVILARKTIKDSQNLNGAGNADQVIDEKELEQAGKKTWLQLLNEKVKGFREGVLVLSGSARPGSRIEKDRRLYRFLTDGDSAEITQGWYYIKNQAIKFIIDGIPVYKIYTPTGLAFNDITNYLNSHSAEDIKGIEVINSTKYSGTYVPIEWAATVRPNDIAFVEITTRSGHGPAIDNTIGVYLYKPLAISRPTQFYKPRYAVKDTTHKTDLRSTIDWEPNINTNKDGIASVSFYAADNASAYNIMIEGTDMMGNIGYKLYKIVVNKHKDGIKSK